MEWIEIFVKNEGQDLLIRCGIGYTVYKQNKTVEKKSKIDIELKLNNWWTAENLECLELSLESGSLELKEM